MCSILKQSHQKSANQAVEIMGDIAQIQEKSRCSRLGRDKLLPAQKVNIIRDFLQYIYIHLFSNINRLLKVNP